MASKVADELLEGIAKLNDIGTERENARALGNDFLFLSEE